MKRQRQFVPTPSLKKQHQNHHENTLQFTLSLSTASPLSLSLLISPNLPSSIDVVRFVESAESEQFANAQTEVVRIGVQHRLGIQSAA